MTAKEYYIELYMTALEQIADDNSHGYNNTVNHNLGQDGQYDCGGFVSEGLHLAGLLPANRVYEPNSPQGQWGYDTILTSIGFVKHKVVESELKRGDILIKDGAHTEVYYKSGKQIGAHSDYDGRNGDSSGAEISICNFSKGYWDYYYRLENIPVFTDCKESDSNYTHIKKMADLGIFRGYNDGTFRGENLMTRKDVAIALGRLYNKLNG